MKIKFKPHFVQMGLKNASLLLGLSFLIKFITVYFWILLTTEKLKIRLLSRRRFGKHKRQNAQPALNSYAWFHWQTVMEALNVYICFEVGCNSEEHFSYTQAKITGLLKINDANKDISATIILSSFV